MKKIHLYILSIILLIATIIRLINIDFLTLWVDEYVHTLRARDFIDGNSKLFTSDNNGILLTIIIIPLYWIGEATSFLGRFPSVLFGLGSIFMIFKLGKSLFNKNVGLFSSLILCFSLYHTFWSRIARNYSIFMFFVLLVLFLLHKFYSHNLNKKQTIKSIALLLLCFVAALLSHQLSFLLILGYACYIIISYIYLKFIKQSDDVKPLINKYSIPLIPSIIIYLLIFSSSFGNIIRPLFTLMLPVNIVNWIIPDWTYINSLWESKPYFTWNLYKDVFTTDLPNLFYLGGLGFIIAFIKNKKSGIFLFSFFIPIILLLSFVFRDPALPRYIIGIYPLFIIAIAVSLDFIYQILEQKIADKFKPVLLIGSLVILTLLCPYKDVFDLITNKNHGNVVPKALSHWSFTDWKSPANGIKRQMQKEDVIMTTNINATRFYLNLNTGDNLFWFRQKKYSGEHKRYIDFPLKNQNKPNAHSLEGIKELVKNNERGWLLADYYFDNIMTDPKAKSFIIENLDYHYSLGNKDIKVFSWDKSRPKTTNKMVEQLGRNPRIFQSQEFNVSIKDISKDVTLFIEAEGLDYANELFVIINRKTKIPVNPNTGNEYKKSKKHLPRQWFTTTVSKSLLKPGQNSIILEHNNKLKNEKQKGCVVYNMKITN